MKFTIYNDAVGEWRWRLQGKNREIIASGEGYQNKKDCRAAVKLIQSAGDAEVVEVIR